MSLSIFPALSSLCFALQGLVGEGRGGEGGGRGGGHDKCMQTILEGQHFFCTWNGEGLPKTGRQK